MDRAVLALGMHARDVPLAVLERHAVTAEGLEAALAELIDRPHVREAVVLSTCNRVEIYAHVADLERGAAELREVFASWSGIAAEDAAAHTYLHEHEAAAAHLFEVVAGLDSLVLGERQIQLQVKRAYAAAQAAGSCGPVLHRLFPRAMHVGKRTRVASGISNDATSMIDLGLTAVEGVLGDLDGAIAVIVGAGKMGGLAAFRLRERAGWLVVANRSPVARQRLARRVGGAEIELGMLPGALLYADVVVCSTASPGPVIDAQMITAAVERRGGQPLVLLDLAVPRDVEPVCDQIPGVTVLDVEGVRDVAGVPDAGREVLVARSMVAEEARAFVAWSRAAPAEPTIIALRARAEAIRAAELERQAGRLVGLDEHQRRAVEKLSRGIVTSLLHEPTIGLKACADGDHAAVVQELFRLPSDERDEPEPDLEPG